MREITVLRTSLSIAGCFRRGLGQSHRRRLVAFVVGILIAALVGSAWAQVTPPEKAQGTQGAERDKIDPRATELLKRMSDYLSKLKEFSVRGASTTEVVLTNGQKLLFTATSDLFVRRPNHVRANRVGDVADIEFFYDGATVSLFGKRQQFYATAPAPPTMDAMLDDMRVRLGMEPPGADLLYSDVYDGLMADVTQALYVGPSVVGGTKTHHLAFRGKDVDWQIWIEDGPRPLPRKYLITTKGTAGEPQFGVELSNWNLSPKLNDAMFKFTPPAGAKKIDFLPLSNAAAKSR